MTPEFLAASVAEFVSDEPGAEQLSDQTWMFRFEGANGDFNVFVSTRGHLLMCAATRDDPVPPARIAAIHELIVDLNSELLLSWFDCHRSNGVISARASLDTEGVEVTSVLIGNVVGAAVEVMQRFLPAVDAVAAGEVDPADLRDPEPTTIDLDTATTEDIDAFFAQFDDD